MARILSTETVIQELTDPWMDAEEAEDCCCDPIGEIPCQETVTWYDGDMLTDAEILDNLGIAVDDQGIDADGHPVSIERVGKPVNGHCGKLYLR